MFKSLRVSFSLERAFPSCYQPQGLFDLVEAVWTLYSVVDMQLIEKAIKHISVKIMILSPHAALWRFLAKNGVSPSMLSVICSLHDCMKAEVTLDGQVAPDFEVSNGLCQDCIIASTLFNLYFSLFIEQWRVKCSEFGVEGFYKIGGKLNL